MSQFAVIKTGGKQYRVSLGEKIRVEKLSDTLEEGAVLKFDEVLLRVDGDKVEVGTPHVKSPVEAKFLGNGRDVKKLVFRYHSKTRYRKKKGHRQHFSELEITKI
jgi:large subunit ribosomal protein L21